MEEAGRAQPLTFGQLSVWRDVETLPREQWYMLNASWVEPLPAGVGAEDVRGALRELQQRHEGLRVTFDDPTGEAPRQVLHAADELAVEVTVRDDVPDDEVDALRAALARRPFDHATELAWRACVVTAGDRPRHLVMVVSHLCADASSHDVLRAETDALLRGETLPPAPSVLALAADQHADAWSRRRDASRAYWRKVLADPAPRPPAPPSAEPEPLALASLHSPAAGRAARAVAARLDISVPAVALAAYFAGIFRTTDTARARVRVMSANRFEPRWRGLVSSMNQWIPLIASRPAGDDFPAFAADIARTSMIASRHGMYDVDEAAALCTELLGRPDALDMDYSFNVIPTAPPAAMAADGPDVEGDVIWGTPFSSAGARCYLKVHQQDALTFALKVPSRSMAGQSAEALLHAMRDALVGAVAAATGGTAATGATDA